MATTKTNADGSVTTTNDDGTTTTTPAPATGTTAVPTTAPAVATTPPATASSNSGLNPDGTPKSLYQTAAESLASQNQMAPTLNTYDPNVDGVAAGVNKITASGSPLMQQADTTGRQQAAARGLTNTTLGGQAAQQAVIAAATPIATSDASLYQQAMLANQTASNTASQTNAQLGVQAGTAGIAADVQSNDAANQLQESGRQFDTTTSQNAQQFADNLAQQNKALDEQKAEFAANLGLSTANLDLQRDTLTQAQQQFLDNLDQQKATLAQNQSQFEASQAQQTAMQTLSGAQQLQVAQVEADNKTAIQNNVDISSAWQTAMTSISAIQNNSSLDNDTKTTLIGNTLSSFAAFSTFWQGAAAGSTDISALLNFGTNNGATSGSGGTTQTPGTQTPLPAPAYDNNNIFTSMPGGNGS